MRSKTTPVYFFVAAMAVCAAPIFSFIYPQAPAAYDEPKELCDAPAALGVDSIYIDPDDGIHKLIYSWAPAPGASQYQFTLRKNGKTEIDTMVEGTQVAFPLDPLVAGDELFAGVRASCGRNLSRLRLDRLKFKNTLVNDDVIFQRITKSNGRVSAICQFENVDYLHFTGPTLQLANGNVVELGSHRSSCFYDFKAFQAVMCQASLSAQDALWMIDALPKIYHYNPWEISGRR